MKEINTKLTLRLSVAAVGLALGASGALAQQQRADDSRQQTQQSQQSRQQTQQQSDASQNPSAARQSGSQRQAADQQRKGDSELDKIVQMHPELGTFVEALETAGLVEELTSATEYTIFAPTNQAFEAMGQNVSELMKAEKRQDLVALLRNHIVADDVDPQMARQINAARTLDGDTISLSTQNDKLMVGQASVVTPNIQVEGSNLRIYTIDKVLGEGQQRTAAVTSGGRD